MTTDLPDAEIDTICSGYKQNAAKIRFLQNMGLHVRRKPNGKPLVNRDHYNMLSIGSKPTIDAEPNWTRQL